MGVDLGGVDVGDGVVEGGVRGDKGDLNMVSDGCISPMDGVGGVSRGAMIGAVGHPIVLCRLRVEVKLFGRLPLLRAYSDVHITRALQDAVYSGKASDVDVSELLSTLCKIKNEMQSVVDTVVLPLNVWMRGESHKLSLVVVGLLAGVCMWPVMFLGIVLMGLAVFRWFGEAGRTDVGNVDFDIGGGVVNASSVRFLLSSGMANKHKELFRNVQRFADFVLVFVLAIKNLLKCSEVSIGRLILGLCGLTLVLAPGTAIRVVLLLFCATLQFW
eukprot:CAMPEP_0113849138 /NCGR_PEP_ID=MMETSP0372-20130328/2927_1 /TAXON_ID=340204 /ORGANISM="Lankesteria abbotti" /LENGTH=271 /DNA_ID=CAMNT_0000818821 /DNA_START=37 /DNA_END=849 /DNA_ORIENTATION=- /assembly_acc=CAM_ASM_000359